MLYFLDLFFGGWKRLFVEKLLELTGEKNGFRVVGWRCLKRWVRFRRLYFFIFDLAMLFRLFLVKCTQIFRRYGERILGRWLLVKVDFVYFFRRLWLDRTFCGVLGLIELVFELLSVSLLSGYVCNSWRICQIDILLGREPFTVHDFAVLGRYFEWGAVHTRLDVIHGVHETVVLFLDCSPTFDWAHALPFVQELLCNLLPFSFGEFEHNFSWIQV